MTICVLVNPVFAAMLSICSTVSSGIRALNWVVVIVSVLLSLLWLEDFVSHLFELDCVDRPGYPVLVIVAQDDHLDFLGAIGEILCGGEVTEFEGSLFDLAEFFVHAGASFLGRMMTVYSIVLYKSTGLRMILASI
jgi:hypothetical protein